MVINQTRTAEVTSEEAKTAEEGGDPEAVTISSVLISAGGPIPKAGYGP